MLSVVSETEQKIIALMDKIIQGNEHTLAAYQHNEPEKYETARISLKKLQIDSRAVDDEITNTFVNLSPGAPELHLLVVYLKINSELERIGIGSSKYARRIEEHRRNLSDLHTFDSVIMHLHRSSITALTYIRDCFAQLQGCDVEENYRKVMVEENKNDDLYGILEKEIMSNILVGSEMSAEYVKVLGTLRRLERIGDRALNIANLMINARQGEAVNQ